jgi:hypothetical protein
MGRALADTDGTELISFGPASEHALVSVPGQEGGPRA